MSEESRLISNSIFSRAVRDVAKNENAEKEAKAADAKKEGESSTKEPKDSEDKVKERAIVEKFLPKEQLKVDWKSDIRTVFWTK